MGFGGSSYLDRVNPPQPFEGEMNEYIYIGFFKVLALRFSVLLLGRLSVTVITSFFIAGPKGVALKGEKNPTFPEQTSVIGNQVIFTVLCSRRTLSPNRSAAS